MDAWDYCSRMCCWQYSSVFLFSAYVFILWVLLFLIHKRICEHWNKYQLDESSGAFIAISSLKLFPTPSCIYSRNRLWLWTKASCLMPQWQPVVEGGTDPMHIPSPLNQDFSDFLLHLLCICFWNSAALWISSNKQIWNIRLNVLGTT